MNPPKTKVEIRNKSGKIITMVNLANLIKTLKKKKLSVSVAESCSAGYLSYLLTKISGASAVFKGGIIVYSLEAKNNFFKIPLPLLEKTKGVSKKIATLLAKKVKNLFSSDIGASIVGFAGPKTKKGTKVGTVFMGFSDKKGTIAKKITIKGNRDQIRKEASKLLIELLYKKLKNDYGD